MNRIFISYRASDGKKEADRLCADLTRMFGDDQVFFDKQDLRGGHSWRQAIETALGTKPVVLLLMTPDILGVADSSGTRRIDREDDPIRAELLAAHQSGAMVIPLLTEGVPMPPSSDLPEALRFISETHALKLRTEDWNHDLDRLLSDLQAHGIRTRKAPRPDKSRWRWLAYATSGFVLLSALASLDPETEPDPEPHASAAAQRAETSVESTGTQLASLSEQASASNLSGAWWAIDSQNRRTAVQLTQTDRAIEMKSHPIPVAGYPEWQIYAQQLSNTQGVHVSHVVYHAQGERTQNSLQLRFEVYSADGTGPLDTGSFTLNVSTDGHEIHGQFWSNGDQASTPVRLVRQP